MFRLDVAVVGFIAFTILGPLAGGYVAAWVVDAGGGAMVALLGGGTGASALASAAGGGAALALTIRFTAGSLLDAFISGWPEDQPLLTDPRLRLLRMSFRASGEGDEIEEEGALGLGGAIGWLGAVVGALLLAGMSIAGWPPVDEAALRQVAAGTGGVLDWLPAAFPEIARIVIAAVLGTLAGAVWSIMTSPVANETP